MTTVELCELPGHALSPLGACVNLKHLKMTHCGLIALDSLSQCKHLQCIDVQVSSVCVFLKHLQRIELQVSSVCVFLKHLHCIDVQVQPVFQTPAVY